MAADPELVAETRGWLAKAAEDLGAGELEFSVTPPFLSDIAFHSQQGRRRPSRRFSLGTAPPSEGLIASKSWENNAWPWIRRSKR